MQENLNMTPKPKILLVDDKLDNLFVLEKNLACLEVESICALSGKQAIGEVLKHDFALLIIDVQMPEMDGYQTVEQLRQNPEHRQLPVIFVSAVYSDDFYKIKGFDVGAVDFIPKPFTPQILVGKVRNFLELYAYKKSIVENNIKLNKINQQLQQEIKRRQHVEEILRLSNKALKQGLEVCKNRLQNLQDIEQCRQFVQQAKKSIQAVNKTLR
jgi:DNA-binding response OmpR family regulator